MLKVIRKAHLGNIDYQWIKISHHFSFGNYYDKNKMGIGHLRTLNVTHIYPDSAYEKHHHRDLEMISYIYEGTLSHTTHEGVEVNIVAPSVQYLGAGNGYLHGEANNTSNPVKLVEIWFDPIKLHLDPKYQHEKIIFNHPENKLVRIASPKLGDGLVKVRQDASVFVLKLSENHYRSFSLQGTSEIYLVLLEGEAYINSEHLYPGDAIHATETIHIQPITLSHFVIVEII